VLAALLLCLVPVACNAPHRANPQAVLLVRGGAWLGSAVVWDAAAHLALTALHVVEEMPEGSITVTAPGRPPQRARIVDRDPELDLALLEVSGEVEAGPPIGASISLKPGESIDVAGCPAARCRRRAATVLQPSLSFAGSRYVEIGCEVHPGASGGPVLDASGALVGIVDLAWTKGRVVALAIPVERAAARFPRGGERVANLFPQ
jgi:S1-C subfamily serine protease